MGLEPTISCLGSKRSRVHLNIGEHGVPKLIYEDYTPPIRQAAQDFHPADYRQPGIFGVVRAGACGCSA